MTEQPTSRAQVRQAPPPLVCVRCGAPTVDRGAEVCSHCGLRMACAQCHERYENPRGQRFCSVCGTPVAPPAAPAREPSTEAPAPDEPRKPRTGRLRTPHLPELSDLFGERPSGTAPLGARVRRRGQVALRTTARHLVRSIGELYLMLGEALAEAGRFDEATEAYRRALRESGGGLTWQSNVYASLVESTLQMAEADPAVRAQALQAALNASRLAPETLPKTIERAIPLLGPDMLNTLGQWILNDWWPKLATLDIGVLARTRCRLLVARVALFLGDHGRALEWLSKLRDEAATDTMAFGPKALQGALLPEALIAAEPGFAHWILAQAHEAVGDDVAALREVEAALVADFPSGDDSQVQALELRAKLLARSHPAAAAGSAYVELGRALTERGRIPEAITALREAAGKLPNEPEPRWRLADAHRLAAELHERPFLDEAELRAARTAAAEGFAMRELEPQDAWACCMLALLESVAALRRDEFLSATWRGALATERALALDPESTDAWALQSRCFRHLGLYSGACLAADRAIATDDANLLAVQEQVALHVELYSGRAHAVIDRHRSRLAEYESALESLKGHLLLLSGEYRQALERLTGVLLVNEQDPYARLRHGLALLLTSAPGAQDDFRHVRTATAGTATPYLAEHAWATWLLGDVGDAEQGFGELRERAGLDAVEGCVGLACCAASRGDAGAVERSLAEALDGAPPRGAAALVRFAVDLVEHEVDDVRLAGVLARAREEAVGLRSSAREPRGDRDAVIAELRERLAATEPGTVPWLVVQAALGRLIAGGGDWAQALEIYSTIVDRDADRLFPEARRAQVRCLHGVTSAAVQAGDVAATERAQSRLLDLGAVAAWQRDLAIARAHRAAGDDANALARVVWLLEPGTISELGAEAGREIGDLLLDLDRLDEAEDAYFEGWDAAPAGTVKRGRLEARIALIAAMRDEIAAASQWFLHAVTSVADEVGETNVGIVVDECDPLAAAVGRPGLDAALRALLEDPLLSPGLRRELIAARFRRTRARRKGKSRVRPVSPVVLSIDARLLPPGESSPLAVQLVESECPALRRRLHERAGIRVPGVRVRPHLQPLAGGEDYTILVREVPVAGGVLPEGRRLCRQGTRCRQLGLRGPTLELGVGLDHAVWLDEQACAVAAANDLDLLDAAEALAWHLEVTLRPRLAEFVGLSEVRLELDEWVAGGGRHRADLLERAAPSRRARARLARVVHRLVQEQVAIGDVWQLLTAYADARDRRLEFTATVESVRGAVAAALTPDRFERQVIELASEVEAEIAKHVRETDSTTVLAVPESDVDDLLASVERQLDGVAAAAVALVVRDGAVRPFVQCLVDSRWSGVPVMSRSELRALRGSTWRQEVEAFPAGPV